ncbi:MAG TPA: CarD family transcriptional regulator, partial [Agriterribacter sp.]|nr:CarD family transcriptional regulator [Agriterribacter sp.]
MLLETYLKDTRIFQIADRIVLSEPQRVFLKNLHGSASQFVFGSVFRHDLASRLNHLVILNDAEEAAYFHNTLENLTSALNVFYFPSSFKNRKNYRQLNASHVMLRTETLTRFSMATGNRVGAIITHPEALFEKVVLPKTLSGNIIRIKAGDSINVSELLSQFVDYGFERTDFVYEPGQFALRGGILDIYSFGNEKPYRIELFGNDVDSIRIFDPETQLSERKLLQVTIIPNVETQFDPGDKVSLPAFLPENTVVWVQDWDVIKEKLQVQEEDLEIFFRVQETAGRPQNDIEDNPEKKEVSSDDFVPAAIIEEQLQLRHIVEFGHTPHFGGIEIAFDTKEQPSFNRQFEFLVKDLENWKAKKYSIYLFAENPRQLERVHSILADMKAEIQFTPVPISIHGGFIAHDLKVVCYTDHQIFQRYHKYRIKQAYNKNKALTLRALRELQPGDYVTHIDHGVGIYSGLQKIEVSGKLQEAVRIIYKDTDILYVNINSLHKIARYTGKEGSVPKINKLGSDAWNRLKEKTKAKVKEIAFDLIQLYAQRKAQAGFAHSPDNYMQTELEASFIYEDTPDQSKSSADVKKDMEVPHPMDRLVCGDVGFGKTEIAVRAAFKTCCDNKQAAVLVPTTILAFQHYKTFKDRLKDFPVTVDYI